MKKLVIERKRRNIKLKWNTKLQKIDELFRLDKQNFWRQIKKIQKGNQHIELDINTILEGYKQQFTTENMSTTELTETKTKLDHLEKNAKKIEVKTNKTKLDDLIKNLPTENQLE